MSNKWNRVKFKREKSFGDCGSLPREQLKLATEHTHTHTETHQKQVFAAGHRISRDRQYMNKLLQFHELLQSGEV